MAQDESFMSYVQMHERAWGIDSYTDRPGLDDIMKARVVVFWHSRQRKEPTLRITLHRNLLALNVHVSGLVLDSRTRLPERRIFRVFVDREMVRIKGVKVVLERIPSTGA